MKSRANIHAKGGGTVSPSLARTPGSHPQPGWRCTQRPARGTPCLLPPGTAGSVSCAWPGPVAALFTLWLRRERFIQKELLLSLLPMGKRLGEPPEREEAGPGLSPHTGLASSFISFKTKASKNYLHDLIVSRSLKNGKRNVGLDLTCPWSRPWPSFS